MNNTNLFTYALLIWAIVTFVLALVELFNHYLTLKGSVYEQSMLDTGVVRRFLHSVIKWSMGAYFVFLFSYVGLALVWLVLSAVLNPEVYLPYAAGANVVMTFFSGKGKAYYSLYSTSYELFRLALAKKLELRLHSMLKKVKASPLFNSSSDGTNILANVVSVVKNDKELAMTLKDLKIQAGELIQLCRLDQTILRETAHKHGMDARILQTVVAASCSDVPVIPLIQKLCKTTGVTIDGETAVVLYSLAIPNTPKSLRYAIKKCVLHFSSLRGIIGDDAISAHVVDAIVAMTRGIIDRIVDIASNSRRDAFISDKTGNDATYFFELVRTKNLLRMEYEYVLDLVEVGQKVMGVERPIVRALSDISINIMPHSNSGGNKKNLAITKLTNAMGKEGVSKVHPTMVRLLVACANFDANTLRVVGPGSNIFQEFLVEKQFIDKSDDPSEKRKSEKLQQQLQQKLAIVLSCAWGTKIDLYKLARRFAIQTERCIAMAHLISEECGDGNFRLGLRTDKTFSHMLIPTQRLKLKHVESLLGLLKICEGSWLRSDEPKLYGNDHKKVDLLCRYVTSFITEVTDRMGVKAGFREILVALLNLVLLDDPETIKACAKTLFKYEDDKTDDETVNTESNACEIANLYYITVLAHCKLGEEAISTLLDDMAEYGGDMGSDIAQFVRSYRSNVNLGAPPLAGSKEEINPDISLRQKFRLAFLEDNNGMQPIVKESFKLFRCILTMDRRRPELLFPRLYKIWGLKAPPKVKKALKSIVGFSYLIHKVLNKPSAQMPIMKTLQEREARQMIHSVSSVLEVDQLIFRAVVEIALSNSILLASDLDFFDFIKDEYMIELEAKLKKLKPFASIRERSNSNSSVDSVKSNKSDKSDNSENRERRIAAKRRQTALTKAVKTTKALLNKYKKWTDPVNDNDCTKLENVANNAKLKAVMKLLDTHHEDDFDVLCHEIKRVESQGRFAMEAINEYCNQEKDVIQGAGLVPKFILEFLIYHKEATIDHYESRKLLENVIQHHTGGNLFGNEDEIDPEILKLCRSFGKRSTEHIESFEVELGKNFAVKKKQKYNKLSLLLDMFGKTTAEAKILGSYRFVEQIGKNLDDKKIKVKKTKKEKSVSKTKKKQQPIDPNSAPKLIWDMFVSLLTLYAVVSTIIFIALDSPVSIEVLYVDSVVDVFFIVDIMLNFMTAFVRHNGRVETSFSEIRKHYFRHGFLLDVTASIPISLILLLSNAQDGNLRANKLFRMVRLPKLLRFYRTFVMIQRSAKRRRGAYRTVEFAPQAVAAAYVAFATTYTSPLALPLWDKEKGETYTANYILSTKFGVPEVFLKLVSNVALRNQKEVKNNLIELISTKRFHGNTPEENIARGFISLATGEVDSIEDLAQAVNFDADVAEGLSLVAGSVTSFVPLARFLTSSSLNKVFTRCGLSLKVMAALLAIVNRDFKHGDEISNSISLIKINGRYLRAIMAVYREENPKSRKEKRESIRKTIRPIARLYKLSDIEVVTSIIRLVQGDVNVIRTFVKEKLKWNKHMADAATAFVLLSQAHKIPLDFNPSARGQWDETRHAKTACRLVANSLTRYKFPGIDRDSLMFILCATLPESDNECALAKLTKSFKEAVNKELMDETYETLMNLLEEDEDEEEEEEDEKNDENDDDDEEEEEDDHDTKTNGTDTDAESNGDDDDDGESFRYIYEIILKGRYKRNGPDSIEKKLVCLDEEKHEEKKLLNAIKAQVNDKMKYIDIINVLRLILNGEYAFRRKQKYGNLNKAREKAKKEADCKEDVFQKKANKDALEEARFFVQLQFLVSVASGDTDKVLQVQGNYLCKCKSGKKSKNCCAPCTCPDANGEKFKFCCGLCICGLHKDCEKKGKTIYEENSKPAKDCCRKKCTCDTEEDFEICCSEDENFCKDHGHLDKDGNHILNQCAFAPCKVCKGEESYQMCCAPCNCKSGLQSKNCCFKKEAKKTVVSTESTENTFDEYQILSNTLVKLKLGRVGKRNKPGLEFLLHFASKNKEAWEVQNTVGVVSSKIHPKTDVVTAIAALAAHDVGCIQTHCSVLCSYLSLDAEIVLPFMNIAIGNENKIRKDVKVICDRIRANPATCMAFVSGATLNQPMVLDWITATCSNLDIPPQLLCAIILCAQCREHISLQACKTIYKFTQKVEDDTKSSFDEIMKNQKITIGDFLVALVERNSYIITKVCRKEDTTDNLDIEKLLYGDFGRRFSEGHRVRYKKLEEKKKTKAAGKQRKLKSKKKKKLKKKVERIKDLFITNFLMAVSAGDPKYVDPYFAEMGVEDAVEKTLLRNILLVFNRKAKPTVIAEIDTILRGKEITKAWNVEDPTKEYPLKLITRVFGIKKGFLSLFYSVMTNNLLGFESWAKSMVEQDEAKLKLMAKEDILKNDVYQYMVPALIAVTRRRFGKNKFTVLHKKGFSKFLNLPEGHSSTFFEFLFSVVTCDLQTLCEKAQDKETLYKEIGYMANRLHVYFKAYALDAKKFFPFKEIPRIIVDKCREKMLPKLSEEKRNNSRSLSGSVEAWCQLCAGGKANIGKGGENCIGKSVTLLVENYVNDDELLNELNTLFLAAIDAPTYMNEIKDSLHGFTKKMMPKGETEITDTLIRSIVNLCSPQESEEEEEKAFDLASQQFYKCFTFPEDNSTSIDMDFHFKPPSKCPVNEAKAIVSLARSDMKTFGLIGRELGEYNTDLMRNMSNLVMRVFPLIGSGEESNTVPSAIKGEEDSGLNVSEENGDEDEEEDEASNVRDRQVAIVFSTFDKSNLGYLNLYDFQTVMKCYSIELTDHKALELLCVGDTTAAGLIDMDGLSRILLQIEGELTLFLLKKELKDVMNLASKFIAAFLVLLFLLSFVYLGITAFGKSDVFNSVINSLLPMGLGVVAGFVGDAGKEEEEMADELDEDGRTEEKDNEIEAALDMIDVSQFKSM